jgi:hypothetical protein
MSVKTVDPVTKAMAREKGVKVTDGNLMDKIGRPDHSGWMRKKGEQYNTWKMRFFVLKGTYLYYLKSEAVRRDGGLSSRSGTHGLDTSQEQRAKGVIDLTGYRVISDPDIRPGEFAFKITHPSERTHYFAAAEQITIRTWMKEILKATIFRDYAGSSTRHRSPPTMNKTDDSLPPAPVVSSCDIETLSLDAAKTLSPRPPSPTQRAEIQKRRCWSCFLSLSLTPISADRLLCRRWHQPEYAVAEGCRNPDGAGSVSSSSLILLRR